MKITDTLGSLRRVAKPQPNGFSPVDNFLGVRELAPALQIGFVLVDPEEILPGRQEASECPHNQSGQISHIT
jgi:hypothetical protein